jgi:glycine/D-amino acid oxidase-like deaminating enzyme/nitrite reductase/ring-hydroxylating ferredoxin subunit
MNISTKSIWEDTAGSIEEFPSFSGDQKTDIAIVGGGITGLTAAMLLSDAGKEVVLLEARKIGLGTTGNSTGNLYATIDEHLSHIRKKWNDDVMKKVVRSREAALNLIENTISRQKIECDFKREPFTFFLESSDDKAEEFIKDEYEALKDAGLNPKMMNDAGLPYKTIKALRVEGQAQFHPLKYARQLAKAVSSKCKIYENSKVEDIDEKAGVLKTSSGTLKANTILLATHTPIGVYAVHTMMFPYREFGVAAELKDGNFTGGIFWSANQPKHSVRTFKSEGKNYVMVIGDKFKTGQHGDTKKYIQALENYLKERLNVSETKYVWGGQQYRTADGLPYIGKHSDKIYFLTGFATDGLIYGTLASMIVSDEILGKTNSWADTYKADRFTPLKSAKDLVTEGANTVAQYIKDTPWNVDAKSLSEINNGEGKIIEKDQEKLAVYKDENGKTHIVSAVCTHMKCIVNWNGSEKSWDCPCHGSRFDINGKVIEGPAYTDLAYKKYNQ